MDDIIVEPGKIGIVTAKIGKSREDFSFLVDNEGDREERLATADPPLPGRYRLNTYAYDVKLVDVDACVEAKSKSLRRESGPTLIPPGYVGVVTNKTDNPITGEKQGIQDNVLQPGIYFLNPEEKRIDIVSIGFNESTLMVETRGGSEPLSNRLGKEPGKDPDYVAGKGIEFPSNDGFQIHLDYTAIWGILPDQAPDVVRQFGTLKAMSNRRSSSRRSGAICRQHGSKRGRARRPARRRQPRGIPGPTPRRNSRTGPDLRKNLTLLFGLTSGTSTSRIRSESRSRKARIADELTKTRDQEQRTTAKAQADLSEAKAKVVQEQDRTKAETEKMIAQVTAEGEKKAKEIDANTERLKAGIDAKTAIVQAEITKAIGEANAKTVELSNQAEAERYRQYVQTLGGADAYNRYVFAEGLSKDLRLGVFYAGPGTFWTDLKGFEQVMLGKLAEDASTKSVTPVVNRSASPSR